MATQAAPNELSQQAQARVGTTLRGKWRLDSLLGVGGMASVYAATHRNGHRVAIKILHPAMSLTSSVQERFLREGYTANNVDHAGIARIVDDDQTEDGDAFLVMELLNGETLDTRWRRLGGRLPLGESLAVAHALLDVLEAAHQSGVLHRDIKPENIFLTDKGQLKLLDFGIARMRETNPSAPSVTRTGATLGTPAFMSPEQARGRSREIDGRSDVWAVGATLFTLLTSRFVHPGETPNEVLIKTATESATPLSSLREDLSPAVCHLVDRALAFQTDERWPSAAAMRDAIADLARSEQIELVLPFGDASARPASLPDFSGATVESAPPCGPVAEPTPGPAQFSLPPPPARRGVSPLLSAGAVALAIAACFALLRPASAPSSTLAAAPPPPPPAASSAPSAIDAVPAIAVLPAEALPPAPEPAPSASSTPPSSARSATARSKPTPSRKPGRR